MQAANSKDKENADYVTEIYLSKLDEIRINEFIEKKSYNTSIKKSIKKNKIEDKNFSIEDEIYEMKNDIKTLKNTLKELVDMMNAVYEFEDS